jgi:serine/threonine protein kinase
MTDSSATEHDNIGKLADRFIASYRAGRCPSVEEYVEQFPELAVELRGLLMALLILEQNGSSANRIKPSADGSSAADPPPRQIGDYLVVREIGRGGMGIVYEAVQQSLGRQVALKVLSLPGRLNSSHLERFRREAHAAARLQHSHVVPVFGFGAHDGTYYYAMQYVPGQSLDLIIESLRQSRSAIDRSVDNTSTTTRFASGTPPSLEANLKSQATTPDPETCAKPLSDTDFSTGAGRRQFYRDVARLGLQAVEALDYAHSEGILHRDIKPSNLLLDAKGNIWITDFGLAKMEGAEELTQSGDFVGTLRYAAPERLEGWSDHRSDLYSLGVTLYELLTQRTCLPYSSRAELLRRIVEDSPVAPRRTDADIPIDLETIVLKAIAKEPADRYHRADQMAEDLRRFLADRPILARRSTIVERFGRWCRRNPLIASLAAAVVLLLVTAVAILAVSNAQIRRESLAKTKALKDREMALSEKEAAIGQAHVFQGLYDPRNSEDDVLRELNEAMKHAPKNPDYLWLRGFQYGFLNRWDEALADMTKARPLLGKSKLISAANRDWFVAMVYVAKGDQAGYQAECEEALSKILSEPRLRERGTLLWMCCVTPDGVKDPAKLADFVDSVVRPIDKSWTSDELLDVGAALYRADKFTEARMRLEQALDQIAHGKPTVDAMSEIFAHLFLAMSKVHLGTPEEAASDIATAGVLAQTIKPACWVDQLQLVLLTAEAKKAVGESSN